MGAYDAIRRMSHGYENPVRRLLCAEIGEAYVGLATS